VVQTFQSLKAPFFRFQPHRRIAIQGRRKQFESYGWNVVDASEASVKYFYKKLVNF